MKKNLVIVESPTKARTISEILDAGYILRASLGHVRDLPEKKLGINISSNFTPTYIIIPNKRKTIIELKEIASDSAAVYLATDPDREGEAIAWHLIQAINIQDNETPIRRVVFHEITREAVNNAFKYPRDIDMRLVDAQQARRLLDRLVGYKLSPLLWKKVRRGLSAGRVQSVAVRLIVDREREITDFTQLEYWTIEADLIKKSAVAKRDKFRAELVRITDGTKLPLTSEKQAAEVKTQLKRCIFKVNNIQHKDVIRQPSPPFITSSLQQEASRKLRFTAKRTMTIAQQLYEGVTLGKEGSVGLITYMRTDSTHVSASAVTEVRQLIYDSYGDKFLPSKARIFGKKARFAQEAHEAIRPTMVNREPNKVKSFLTNEQYKLYDLVWKRMVASQMAAAIFDTTHINIHAQHPTSGITYVLKTSAVIRKFDGFMIVYTEGKDENGSSDTTSIKIPLLEPNDDLELLDIINTQRFTQPPSRYTEASLIKTLEQKGIGRPSTYAPIISTIQERGYVRKEDGRFLPEDIGIIVVNLLKENFPKIVDLRFTAEMEKELDDIAQGSNNYVSVLNDFFIPFEQALVNADKSIAKIDLTKASDQICSLCGRPMVIKTGRYGEFLACSGFPDCKHKKSLRPKQVVKVGVHCPECNEGELIEKMGKKKRRFYGCNRYPECKFAINSKPIQQPCPNCGKLLVKFRGKWAVCTSCKHKLTMGELEKGAIKI